MLGGRMYVDDSTTPLAMTDTRWAAMTDGKAAAEQVWARRHQINEALIGIGARPHDEFELFVRLNHDGSMTLFDESDETDRKPIQVPPRTDVPDLPTGMSAAPGSPSPRTPSGKPNASCSRPGWSMSPRG